MKRIILSLAMLVSLQFAIAQSGGTLVTSAYNDYRNQYPDKAKASIDKAILDEEAAKEARTWLYRGNIYLQINSVAHMTDGLSKGMKSEDIKFRFGEPISIRNYKKLEDGAKWTYNFDLVLYLSNGLLDSWEYPNEALYRSLDNGKSLDIAYESYQKSLAIDSKFINTTISPMNAMTGLEAVAGSYYNAGINAYNSGKYKEAKYNLESAVKVYTELNQPNPELIYSTGVSCILAGDTTKAIDYYNRAIKLEYQEKLLYYNLVNIYLIQNNTDMAKKVIKIGRKYHPTDQDLLITEANIYLKTGETKEAETILFEAVKNDPTNANLYYVIGSNYDNILRDTTLTTEAKDNAFKQAQEAYKKALELNPDYFDVNFNMGVLLNNKAAELFVEAANTPFNENEKYDLLLNEATEYLKKAEPYLNKAYQLNPKDRDTLFLLKQIYLRTKDTEKFKVISEKLSEIEGK